MGAHSPGAGGEGQGAEAWTPGPSRGGFRLRKTPGLVLGPLPGPHPLRLQHGVSDRSVGTHPSVWTGSREQLCAHTALHVGVGWRTVLD